MGFHGEKKRDDLHDHSWQKERGHRCSVFPVLQTFNETLENKLKRVCFPTSAHSNCTKYLLPCLFPAFKHYFKEHPRILVCLILKIRFRCFISDGHTAEMAQCIISAAHGVSLSWCLWCYDDSSRTLHCKVIILSLVK